MNSEKRRVKPKNRFTLCCFCVGGSGSDPDLSSATYDYSDKCDYVVEKLTIKKVPIAMFATEEDLEEMKKNSVSFNEKVKHKESILSTYYAMINHNNSMRKEFNDLDKISNIESDGKSNKKDEEILLKPILKQNEMQTKVDVHQVILEEPKRFNLSPELQETLKVLGTKRPPETCQDIKKRMGVKVVQNITKSSSPSVKHVTIVENGENFLQTIKDMQEPSISKNVSTTTTTSFQSNSTVQHFRLRQSDLSSQFPQRNQKESNDRDENLEQDETVSPIFVDDHGMLIEKEDVDVRLTSNELEAMMLKVIIGEKNQDVNSNQSQKTDRWIINESDENNISNQSLKTDRNEHRHKALMPCNDRNGRNVKENSDRKEPIGVYNLNPRWKIIIKEHQEKNVSGSKTSVSSKTLTATSGSDRDDDDDEEEEGSDEEDSDDDDGDNEDDEISPT